MAFSFNDIPSFYKTLFPDGLIKALSIAGSPFRARLAMSDDFGGASVKEVPMQYALPQARSRTASKALAQRSTGKVSLAQWTLKPGYDYATMQTKYADILRARKDTYAFGKLQQVALNTTLASLNDSINRSLLRDGTGAIAQIASVSTATATLVTKADSYLFEIGMECQFFNSTGSNSVPTLLGAAASCFVQSIDTEAGTVTFDTTLANISASIAANTYILAAGDGVGYGSTLEDGAIVGIAAFFPVTAPSPGTTLWGQDVGLYPVKLSGHRADARNKVLYEEVQRMVARIMRLKGKPDTIYCAPEQVANIIIGRDGMTENFRQVMKVRGDDGNGGEMVQEIGFDGVRIRTPNGALDIFGDPFCPADRVYVVQQNTLKLSTMGDFPHLVTMGNVAGQLQEADSYSLQSRFFASGQFFCDAPAYNGVLQVTPIV